MKVKLERRGDDDVYLTVEAESDTERMLLDMLMMGDTMWVRTCSTSGPHPCNYHLGPATVTLHRWPRATTK